MPKQLRSRPFAERKSQNTQVDKLLRGEIVPVPKRRPNPGEGEWIKRRSWGFSPAWGPGPELFSGVWIYLIDSPILTLIFTKLQTKSNTTVYSLIFAVFSV